MNIMLAVAEGRPEDIVLSWSDKWAVSVVLASEGYPGSYEKGKVILGLEEAQDLDGVIVFHAGTALNPDGELITAGGRVLNVVALGDTFEEARRRSVPFRYRPPCAAGSLCLGISCLLNRGTHCGCLDYFYPH